MYMAIPHRIRIQSMPGTSYKRVTCHCTGQRAQTRIGYALFEAEPAGSELRERKSGHHAIEEGAPVHDSCVLNVLNVNTAWIVIASRETADG
jgi:hypothetical protein